MMSEYAIITGTGRSGSNWLLNILDASEFTHCRNEPHAISDSPFQTLPSLWRGDLEPPDLEEVWDNIAAWTRSHVGERDHYIKNPKRHVYPISQITGLASLPQRPKLRPLFQMMMPQFRRGEWKLPWWVGRQRDLEQAFAVFKIINLDPRIPIWILTHRPHVPLLHIVRHPGGRFNSWSNRFLAERDEATVLQTSRDRLYWIRELNPGWAQQMGPIEEMSFVELTTWFWRYVNEEIYTAGQHSPNYLCIIYEQLTQDPLAYAHKIYDFCQLPWDEHIEAIIRKNLGYSVWGKLSGAPTAVAANWKTKLNTTDIDAIDRILDGSSMRHWWDSQGNSTFEALQAPSQTA